MSLTIDCNDMASFKQGSLFQTQLPKVEVTEKPGQKFFVCWSYIHYFLSLKNNY